MTIDFDGRPVLYGAHELDQVVLAYATTMHKAQGCEYPAVVIPVTTQHYPMLQRNLIYTGDHAGAEAGGDGGAEEGAGDGRARARIMRRWSKLGEWLRVGTTETMRRTGSPEDMRA